MKNSVTIYSNGIVNLFKHQPLEKGDTKVVISVSHNNVDLAFNSLNIFGNFKFKNYPSSLNKTLLNLDSNNFYYGLLNNLSGRDVKISTSTSEDVSGTLLGIQNTDKEDKFIVVLKKDALNVLPLSEVTDIHLCGNTVDFVKSSLNLDKQSKINFTVSSEKESDLYYQYSLQCEPWKVSYRLLRCENSFALIGLGFLTNSTEENWESVSVNFVCGSPLNNSLNKNQNESIMTCCRSMSFGNSGTEVCDSGPKESELSDFYIFKFETPTTIPSNSSSLIPLFTKNDLQAEEVLHYQFGDLYRAIRFKNELNHNLPAGNYTFILNGIDSGSNFNKLIKKQEVVNLDFSEETSVEVDYFVKSSGDVSYEFAAISDGVLFLNKITKTKVFYDVKNIKSSIKFVADFKIPDKSNCKATVNEKQVENFVGNNELVFNLEKDSNIEVYFSTNSQYSIVKPCISDLLDLLRKDKKVFDGVEELKEVLSLLKDYSSKTKKMENLDLDIQFLIKDQNRLKSIDMVKCQEIESIITEKRSEINKHKHTIAEIESKIDSILKSLDV